MSNNNTNKIHYLDGIRGIAALFVFFHHFGLVFYTAYYTADFKAVHLNNWEIVYGKSLLSVLTGGNFWVYVFFVLSGFVLSRKYFQSHDYEIIISGVQRRFLRLYIPIAFTLILSFILFKAHLYFNYPVSLITHSEWWFKYMWIIPDPFHRLLECLTYTTMFNGDSIFDTSLWSISSELYGSLFVFAFLALTHKAKNRLAILLLVLLYAWCTDQDIVMIFTLGIFLNYAEQIKPRLNKYAAGSLAIFFLVIAIICGAYPITGTVQDTIFDIAPNVFLIKYYGWYHIFGAYFLVLAFLLSPILQRPVSSNFFRFLGRVSFSFYLLHPLILGSFSSFLFLRLYRSFGYNPAVMIVFVSTIGFAWLLSWLMAKYIDEPGTKLTKYIYNRWVKKENR